MVSLLRVEQIAYALPYRVILQALSFEVAAGEWVLVTGAKGSGKTLLLKLLNRLTTPSSGQVWVADRDYRAVSIPHWRRQVAMVNAEPDLLGMTVQGALLYPLQLQKLSTQQAEQHLVWLLEQWPVPEAWLSLTATQLSRHQQQVVAVARSLTLQPTVLLLDEPMKYLSPEWLERLRAISQAQSMAVVATGHRMEVDRFLYLRSGQLVWDRATKGDSVSTTVDWDELQAEVDRIEQAEATNW